MARGKGAACVLCVTLGCGTQDPCRQAPTGTRLLPLSVGASWTDRVTDPETGRTEDKTIVIADYADVGGMKAGTLAFKAVRMEGAEEAHRWQEDTGTTIVRHRDQWFDVAGNPTRDVYFVPFKLRVDERPEHLVPGATWTETYQEIRVVDFATGETEASPVTETWTTESVDATITVPAGTFTDVVCFLRDDGGGAKRYCWTRGVGKVQEDSPPVEEEILVAYCLPQ